MNAMKASLGSILLLAAVNCGGTDVTDFSYGKSQPGLNLPQGGEVRHENVRIFGFPEQTWLMAYQYTGPAFSANAPFVNLVKGPVGGPFEGCTDVRQGQAWPVNPITGATYLDFPKVPSLTGTGIASAIDVVKTDPPNMVGNSTTIAYDFTYGGGAPGPTPMGFNGTLTAADSTPGGHYTLDIGEAGADGKTSVDYYIPEAYTTPFNIGTRAMMDAVPVPASGDWEFDWTAPANDLGDDGKEHTKKTHFNITLFVAAGDDGLHPQFFCFPEVEGHQKVPADVIAALPAGGLIVHANLTHYMEARTNPGHDNRRFDLVGIFCNISLFSKM